VSAPEQDPRFFPALDLLKRTGVRQVQVRYHDEEHPTIWNVVGKWYADEHDMIVATKDEAEGTMWRVAAGFDPAQALFALLQGLIGEHSGGACTYCMRLTALDVSDPPRDRLVDNFCWWTFNGSEFERGCALS
jgi:hypothetical protein